MRRPSGERPKPTSKALRLPRLPASTSTVTADAQDAHSLRYGNADRNHFVCIVREHAETPVLQALQDYCTRQREPRQTYLTRVGGVRVLPTFCPGVCPGTGM